MNKDWNRFKDICKEFYIQTKQMLSEYADWVHEEFENPWIMFLITILFSAGFTLYLGISITLLACLLILVLTHPVYKVLKYLFTLLAWQTKQKAKKIYLAKTSLTNIYSESLVANILCTILRNNAKELEIVRPSIVDDIIPTKETVSQIENSFLFYRYICQYIDIESSDQHHMTELLDLKISQFLQAHYYIYQITYKDMSVIKIFRISESLHHRGCYSFDIMIVDNEEKYNYCKNLTETTDKPNDIKNDKDF